LRDAGYFDGRNVAIEWRYAKGDYEKVKAFVDEFVQTKVNVTVMAWGDPNFTLLR
jgi:hypothetical protein